MISIKQLCPYSVSILRLTAMMRLTRLLISPSLEPGAWLLKVLDLARTAGCPDEIYHA